MRHGRDHRARLGALAALLALAAAPAQAGSTAIGGTVTFERVPDDWSQSKSTDWQVDLSHTFDSKLIVAGAVKYYDTTGTGDYTVNAQGGIGYTHAFGIVALTGMAGIGQHFIENDEPTSFTYYYFTVALDIALNDNWTWNAVAARYRNAFDTANDYDTPELATGITYKIDAANSVSVKIERDWKDGQVSYDAVEIGYKYRF